MESNLQSLLSHRIDNRQAACSPDLLDTRIVSRNVCVEWFTECLCHLLVHQSGLRRFTICLTGTGHFITVAFNHDMLNQKLGADAVFDTTICFWMSTKRFSLFWTLGHGRHCACRLPVKSAFFSLPSLCVRWRDTYPLHEHKVFQSPYLQSTAHPNPANFVVGPFSQTFPCAPSSGGARIDGARGFIHARYNDAFAILSSMSILD